MKYLGALGCCVILLGCVLVTGCGSGKFGQVSGVVSFDGQPAPQGVKVEFQPQAENASPSYGVTAASGRYTMVFSASQEGVMVGQNVVRLSFEKEYDEHGNEVVPKELKHLTIPASYAAESELTFDVKSGGNTFDINVTADGPGASAE